MFRKDKLTVSELIVRVRYICESAIPRVPSENNLTISEDQKIHIFQEFVDFLPSFIKRHIFSDTGS